MSLIDAIKAQLKENSTLTFMEFMHQALYAPGEGYYSSSLDKLGPQGDFVTAPELTPLFGQTLAHQCQPILSALETPKLFEYGAGTGRLCIDLLKQLETLNGLPEAYYILEVSAHLRHHQKEHIAKEIPHLASIVQWLDRWPDEPLNGVIIANEVLDAMPVHRFMQTTHGLLESHVGLDKNGQLIEQFKSCETPALTDYVHTHLNLTPLPYLSEVNLFLDGWIENNYRVLNKGVLLLIDYGFPRHEYYHPDRHQGTLMCHYKHQAHTNPLTHVGEQDLTAHVDFTHVAEAGQRAGFHVAGYTNQASFLLANGLLNLVNAIENERERIKATQAIKQLIQPSEMGELFKVMALTKNLNMDLCGFQLHDKRVSL